MYSLLLTHTGLPVHPSLAMIFGTVTVVAATPFRLRRAAQKVSVACAGDSTSTEDSAGGNRTALTARP